MICQRNNWNMLQMMEKLSAQAIYYQPWADGLTSISNTGWTNVTLPSVSSSDIHLAAILPEIPQASIIKLIMKATYLKMPFKSPRGQWVKPQ